MALVTGLIWAPGAGTAAPVAPTPTEVTVVTPPVSPVIPVETIVSVGDTGFLHRRDNGTDFLWTRFADKSTSVATALTGASTITGFIHSAGGDYAGWLKSGSPSTVTMVNLADQTSRVLPLPAGVTNYLAATSTTILVRASVGGVGTVELLTYAADGTSTATPVSGVLAGVSAVTTLGTGPVNDTTSAIVQYSAAGVIGDAIVDMHTGVAVAIPGIGTQQVALSDDLIVRTLPGTTLPVSVSVFSRPGLVNGTDTSSKTVTLPNVPVPHIFIAGRHLLVTNSNDESVADVPLDGGAATTLLTQSATAGVMGGPHGTTIAIGGNGPGAWATHQLSGGAGGTLVDDASIPAAVPVANAGISIDSGLLHHVIAAQPAAKPIFVSIDQPILHGPDDAQYTGDGNFRPDANTCQTGVNCLRVVPGNNYGPLYLMANNEISMQTINGTVIPNKVWPWGAGAVIADGSYYYAIVDVPSANQQYVISMGTNSVLSTGTITGAALWYSKLFQSSTAAGSVIESDLDNPTAAKLTIPVGAPCKPAELQADNDWLYWSCGAAGPSGVHNLVTGANVALPGGVAQIGDGYVVMHDADAGLLKLYDFHTGALAGPVTIGTVQTGFVTDDRLITWAVDKRGGDIAYVAADDSVHVVDPGVPHTPARSQVPLVGQWSTAPHNPAGPWIVNFYPNRPLTSWTINITSPVLGLVKTLSGGVTRQSFSVNWNGLNTAGAMVPSGNYSWSASFTTADGTAPVGSGTLHVLCGAYVYRSYDCDGSSGILGVKSTGAGTWYNADKTPTGGLITGGATDSWPWGISSSMFTSVIPWGDYNGDGFGDVLARTGTGTLKAYLGQGQSDFNPSSGVKTVTISTGWQSYKILLTSGDLTGDGISDMLATDASGNLYMMAGKAGGGLAAKVKIGSGWQKYSKLVGVGDITGDKHPDVLGFDSAGNMMLYAGTGHGTLATGVKLGTGFVPATYTAIIGSGDVNRDGHNDLVARDKNGVLWLFPGNGTRGFGARQQIGSGWNTYTHMY
jgi:hypothetical protein